MKLSVIIPAYNEAKLISRCVADVLAAFAANAAEDWTGEVIVVDNNSSDQTGELARRAGATLVFEPVNQISRARNAGARVAGGDWFLFIDADSFLKPATLGDLLAAIRRNRYAGGGCFIQFDEPVFLARLSAVLANLSVRAMRWPVGCFMFCRAKAFRELGGFNTEVYATEDTLFSEKLKEWAERNGLRIAILVHHPHLTSGRKFRLYTWRDLGRQTYFSIFRLNQYLQDRSKLTFYYDGRR
jgi:glycosyltransferase involved in cell wall biosynthesis